MPLHERQTWPRDDATERANGCVLCRGRKPVMTKRKFTIDFHL
jgi:hypothetical protein